MSNRKSQAAQTVGYTIIIVGFIFQIVLSSGYGLLVNTVRHPQINSVVLTPSAVVVFDQPRDVDQGHKMVINVELPAI